MISLLISKKQENKSFKVRNINSHLFNIEIIAFYKIESFRTLNFSVNMSIAAFTIAIGRRDPVDSIVKINVFGWSVIVIIGSVSVIGNIWATLSAVFIHSRQNMQSCGFSIFI